MKTRQELIAAGSVWNIYPASNPEHITHECRSRSACLRWLSDKGKMREYRNGVIRIGKVIHEDIDTPPSPAVGS